VSKPSGIAAKVRCHFHIDGEFSFVRGVRANKARAINLADHLLLYLRSSFCRITLLTLIPTESKAFSSSSLRSVVFPSNVCLINGSAFNHANLSNCMIEPANLQFVSESDCLIDVVEHKLIHGFSRSPHVKIPCDFEILGSSCFAECQSS
jgi:hypothetical protein